MLSLQISFSCPTKIHKFKMMPVRRPKPSDTEDDILRQMAEFEATKAKKERQNAPMSAPDSLPEKIEPTMTVKDTENSATPVMSQHILERCPIVASLPKMSEKSGFPAVFQVCSIFLKCTLV